MKKALVRAATLTGANIPKHTERPTSPGNYLYYSISRAERKDMSAKEVLFDAYLNGEFQTEKSADLSEVSARIDKLLQEGTLTSEEIAEHELNAARAGFYAGLRAARELYTA